MSALDEKGLEARITAYLRFGGLFNPEMADHEEVRDILVDCRDALTALAARVDALMKERDHYKGLIDTMVPIHRDGSHVFIDGPGDVELDHGGKLRARAEAAEKERDEARDENTRLRAALAQSDRPCVYCTLPKDEWSKCASGFPGCGSKEEEPRE